MRLFNSLLSRPTVRHEPFWTVRHRIQLSLVNTLLSVPANTSVDRHRAFPDRHAQQSELSSRTSPASMQDRT